MGGRRFLNWPNKFRIFKSSKGCIVPAVFNSSVLQSELAEARTETPYAGFLPKVFLSKDVPILNLDLVLVHLLECYQELQVCEWAWGFGRLVRWHGGVGDGGGDEDGEDVEGCSAAGGRFQTVWRG